MVFVVPPLFYFTDLRLRWTNWSPGWPWPHSKWMGFRLRFVSLARHFCYSFMTLWREIYWDLP